MGLEALLLSGMKLNLVGQQVITGTGTFDFIVPAGVTSLSGVAVGRASSITGGGGGGLSWRNNIPVTPGEKLTISIGITTSAPTPTSLMRGTTVLLTAGSANGKTGGLGGKNIDAINDGGGNGGTGGSGSWPGGGGAGGYSGKGGNGANGNSTADGNGQNGAGGGGGGGSGYWNGGGGGVGIYGEGESGAGGNGANNSSLNGGRGGSGGVRGGNYQMWAGEPTSPQQGGIYGGGPNGAGVVRLIWGGGRSFPNNAADIVVP